MSLRRNIMWICTAVLFAGSLTSEAQIAPADASRHIGETVTVCGAVRSTRYAFTWKGAPTLLNLDSVEDNFAIVIWGIVIWGKHRKNFRRPDFDYAGTYVCVSGKIRRIKKDLRVEVKDPTQIVVIRDSAP